MTWYLWMLAGAVLLAVIELGVVLAIGWQLKRTGLGGMFR